MLDRELLSVLLCFRESAKEGGAVSICWMAHDLLNNASVDRR